LQTLSLKLVSINPETKKTAAVNGTTWCKIAPNGILKADKRKNQQAAQKWLQYRRDVTGLKTRIAPHSH